VFFLDRLLLFLGFVFAFALGEVLRRARWIKKSDRREVEIGVVGIDVNNHDAEEMNNLILDIEV
jgi:hypothetical protein